MRLRLIALSLLLYPVAVGGPVLFLMQFPHLGLPGPIASVIILGSMAIGLSATAVLARALLIRSSPAAERLSPMWLAGGAVLGGLAAPALAGALAPSAVAAIGRGVVEMGLALAGILLGSFREE